MRSDRERATIGVFTTPGDARRAIEDLRQAGFADERIGILTHDKEGDPDVRSLRDLAGNRAGMGAAVGVAAGAGGGALWALGIAVGILPAIGPVIAGGLLAAIALSAASGAAAAGIVGALVGLGVSDQDAAHYEREFKEGRTILVLQGDERGALARTILMAHHAQEREVSTETLAARIEGTT